MSVLGLRRRSIGKGEVGSECCVKKQGNGGQLLQRPRENREERSRLNDYGKVWPVIFCRGESGE